MKAFLWLFRTDRDISTLILRVVLAGVFFPHGAQKALGWFGGHGFTASMQFFTETLQIPALFGFLAIAAEFAGSIALLFGFCSRVAAFGIGVTMIVASTMHWQNGFFANWSGKQAGEGIEYHLLALGVAIVLMLRGGGRWSADACIAQQIENR